VADSTYIMIFVALIAFGLVIGFLGSMLAMRRYLKV
jgi:cell division protein FtsX